MKCYLFIAIITLISIFSSVVVLAAETYRSKNFPPQEIIVKNHDKMVNDPNYKIAEIVGKYQRQDNIYYMYFYRSVRGKVEFHYKPMTLIRLDSNIWLIGVYDYALRPLEK